MNRSGWRHWAHEPPPRGVLIQVQRDEWSRPCVCTREDVAAQSPWGLFWKITGIGREQMEQYHA